MVQKDLETAESDAFAAPGSRLAYALLPNRKTVESPCLSFGDFVQQRKIINLFQLRRFFQPHVALGEREVEFIGIDRRSAICRPGARDMVVEISRLFRVQ